MAPPKKKPAKKGAGKSESPKKPARKSAGKAKSPKKPKKVGKLKVKKGGPKGAKKLNKKELKAADAEPQNIVEIGTADQNGEVEVTKKITSKKLITDDAKVIMVLWSFEILHQLMQSLRTSFTKDALSEGQLTQDLHAHMSSSVAMMVFVTSITMAVGNYVLGKPKFSVLMIGLIIYMATTMLGIKMLAPHPIGYAVLLILAQIGWHAVTPIRYWFIFHQSFPLSVKTSAILVTVNECLEALAQYVGAVWVEHKVFGWRPYLFSWMVLSIAITLWLGALLYAKVSNLMNSTPDDREAIENSYKSTEAVNSFEARQTSKHWKFFLLLISPSMMFPAVKETVGIVVQEQVNPHPITRYRPDIVLAIVFMPVASAGLVMLNILRHEIRGMLLVGFAKFLNIIVLILYLVMVIMFPTLFRRESAYTRLESSRLVNSMPTLPPIGVAYIIVDGEVKYYSNGDGNPYKDLQNVFILIKRQINNRVLMPMKLYDKNRKLIARREIVLFPRRINVYALFRRNIKFLPGITKRLTLISKDERYWIFNSNEPCPLGAHSDGGKDGKIWVNKTCKSLMVETSQLTADRSVLHNKLEIIPRPGDISEANIINKTTKLLKTSLFLDGSKISETLSQPGPDRPWTIIVVKRGTKPEVLLETFAISREIWEQVNYGKARAIFNCLDPETTEAPVFDGAAALCIVAMCVAGVAFGLASVSYIHFVWIQCPHDNRMLILAGFFTINYIGGWMARHLVTEVNLVMIVGLLVMQALFWIWHIVALVYFRGILPLMTEEDTNMGANRRF